MIVVVGSTGSTGSHLVAELRKGGHRVRATARDLERARKMHGADVDVVLADLERPETLAPALEGAERVYVAVGGASCVPDLDRVEIRLIDAAKAVGVQHYVKCSGIDSAPDGPSEIQRIHGRIEEHLRSSGIPWTILRPSFFMQNFLGLAGPIGAGALPMPTGSARAGIIDARDIGDVALSVLTHPGHEGRTYTLTGAELLSHGEAAAIMSRVLERKVDFHDVPPDLWARSLADAGLPPWFAARLTDVYVKVFAAGGASRVTDDVERVTGKKPRELGRFVRDHTSVFVGRS